VTLWGLATKLVDGSAGRDEFEPVLIESGENKYLANFSKINLSTLRRVSAEGSKHEVDVPGAPTALAEDVFIELTQFILDPEVQKGLHENVRVVKIADFPAEARHLHKFCPVCDDAEVLHEALCKTSRAWVRNTPLMFCPTNPPSTKEQDADQPPNFWITIE
jgi:hypothetical protein